MQPTQLPTSSSAPGTFKEAFELFEGLRGSFVKSITVSGSYGPTKRTLVRDLGDRPLESFTHMDLLRFVETQLKHGRKPSGIMLNIRVLRAFGNWAAKHKLLPLDNPFAEMEGLRVADKPVRFLTQAEFQRIYNAEKSVKLRNVWLFGLLTGLRAGDLGRLSWEHIDTNTWQIHLTMGKVGKMHVVPMHNALIELLKKMGPRASGPLWGTTLGTSHLSHRFKRAAKDAGIPDVSLHALRRTFASWLVSAGAPLIETQRLMGHSTPSLTAKYYVGIAGEELRPHVSRLPVLTGSLSGSLVLAATASMGMEVSGSGVKPDEPPQWEYVGR